MNDLKLEILNYNYWEHFKSAKELSLILPLNHKRRLLIEKNLQEILDEIHKLTKEK